MPVHSPLLLAGLLLAAPSMAQSPMEGAPMKEAPACPAPVAPTGLLAPWSAPVALKAGADDAHAARLAAGQAAQVDLLPTPSVTYRLQPGKPGAATSQGGVLALDVKQAGTWRIALGAAAWLDVVGDDGAQRSIAHGHGPECSGIRKMVDFALKPGHYAVQLSASQAAQIRVLVLALP